MIGSLWDLKQDHRPSVDNAIGYHDRFPMGFETNIYHHLIFSILLYHDRFPMGFETSNNMTIYSYKCTLS